ncbi:MAG: cbb3-type cytochrome c oxidase subunit 3 [Pseudomonadota bacterium]
METDLDTYDTLRHFADSWFLIAMMVFFLGVVAFTLRPGSRALHRDIADIPFRGDKAKTTDSTDTDTEGRAD